MLNERLVRHQIERYYHFQSAEAAMILGIQALRENKPEEAYSYIKATVTTAPYCLDFSIEPHVWGFQVCCQKEACIVTVPDPVLEKVAELYARLLKEYTADVSRVCEHKEIIERIIGHMGMAAEVGHAAHDEMLLSCLLSPEIYQNLSADARQVLDFVAVRIARVFVWRESEHHKKLLKQHGCEAAVIGALGRVIERSADASIKSSLAYIARCIGPQLPEPVAVALHQALVGKKALAREIVALLPWLSRYSHDPALASVAQKRSAVKIAKKDAAGGSASALAAYIDTFDENTKLAWQAHNRDAHAAVGLGRKLAERRQPEKAFGYLAFAADHGEDTPLKRATLAHFLCEYPAYAASRPEGQMRSIKVWVLDTPKSLSYVEDLVKLYHQYNTLAAFLALIPCDVSSCASYPAPLLARYIHLMSYSMHFEPTKERMIAIICLIAALRTALATDANRRLTFPFIMYHAQRAQELLDSVPAQDLSPMAQKNSETLRTLLPKTVHKSKLRQPATCQEEASFLLKFMPL